MDKADSLRGLTKVGKESLARLSLANLASLKDLRAELERIAKGTPELIWQGLPKESKLCQSSTIAMDKADSLRGLTKVGRDSLARLSLANLASLKDLRAELERIAKGKPELIGQGLLKVRLN